MLKGMEKHQGGQTGLNPSHDATGSVRLKDMGVTRDQSSNWQRLAELPDEVYEEFKAERRAAEGGILASVTISGDGWAQEEPEESAEPVADGGGGRMLGPCRACGQPTSNSDTAGRPAHALCDPGELLDHDPTASEILATLRAGLGDVQLLGPVANDNPDREAKLAALRDGRPPPVHATYRNSWGRMVDLETCTPKALHGTVRDLLYGKQPRRTQT